MLVNSFIILIGESLVKAISCRSSTFNAFKYIYFVLMGFCQTVPIIYKIMRCLCSRLTPMMPLVWENGECVRAGKEPYTELEYAELVGRFHGRLPDLKERLNF